MEQRINTVTWTFSGAAISLLLSSIIYGNPYLFGTGFILLALAGAVYYIGNAVMELKNKKK